MSIEAAVLREIEELHDFFEAWLGGTGEPDLARFTDVMDSRFTLVTPAGEEVPFARLLENLRAGRAARPGFRIRVEGARVLHDEPPIVVASYDERQDGGGDASRRRSTVVFRHTDGAPNGLVWLRVHETWTTDEAK